MKLYNEGLDNYEPWSGAIDTFETIEREGKLDDLEQLLNEIYSEGMSETQLNDLLWFESDWVFEMLGIKDEEEEE